MNPHTTILKHLHTAAMSLSDLQAVTQVSLPTLRKAMQELTDTRWIRVVGQMDSNGGRPAKRFGLDSNYYIIIGVHLQLPGLRLITADLTGQVLDAQEIAQDNVPPPEQVLHDITEYVRQVQAHYSERPILGIGVAAPGFTDPDSGDILSIGRVSGWERFPICRRLQGTLQLPVYIANDVDCMAFTEFQQTGMSFDRNLIYVGFDEGVKMSIFLNGELYQGAFGNAGLVFSDLLQVNYPSTKWDRDRILTIHGFDHVFEERVAALDADDQAAYQAIFSTSNARQRFHAILQGAEQGLPACEDVVGLMNVALASAATNVIYTIQPDTVVIGGILSGMPDSLYITLKDTIHSYLPKLISDSTAITQGKVTSPNSAAVGATHHFLQNYLAEEPVNLLQLD